MHLERITTLPKMTHMFSAVKWEPELDSRIIILFSFMGIGEELTRWKVLAGFLAAHQPCTSNDFLFTLPGPDPVLEVSIKARKVA